MNRNTNPISNWSKSIICCSLEVSNWISTDIIVFRFWFTGLVPRTINVMFLKHFNVRHDCKDIFCFTFTFLTWYLHNICSSPSYGGTWMGRSQIVLHVLLYYLLWALIILLELTGVTDGWKQAKAVCLWCDIRTFVHSFVVNTGPQLQSLHENENVCIYNIWYAHCWRTLPVWVEYSSGIVHVVTSHCQGTRSFTIIWHTYCSRHLVF